MDKNEEINNEIILENKDLEYEEKPNDEINDNPEEKIQEPKTNEEPKKEMELEEQKIESNVRNEEFIIQIFSDFKDAIKRSDLDKIKELLNKYQEQYDLANKIDPTTKQTSIFLAALLPDEEKSFNILQILLQHGKFIKKKSLLGANPFYHDSLKQNVIFYLSRDGRSQIIDLLLEYNVKIDEPDNFGQTPLYYACREGRSTTADFLLEKGANVNHTDSISNQTALFYAAREGHYDTCKVLIDRGCDYNHVDNKKQTALHWAKKHNKRDVVQLLSSVGAQTKTKVTKKAEETSQNDEKSSILKKRKREKEDIKISYKLVYTDENNNQTELTLADFEKFKAQHQAIAEIMMNPEGLIDEQMINDTKEKTTWEKIAKKILNHLWKMKGAFLFHQPVDPIKLKIEDYFEIVKNPMDFSTIKSKLNNNVYKNLADFITDMKMVFENCILYNGTESEVGKIGIKIAKEFESQCQQNNIFALEKNDDKSN